MDPAGPQMCVEAGRVVRGCQKVAIRSYVPRFSLLIRTCCSCLWVEGLCSVRQSSCVLLRALECVYTPEKYHKNDSFLQVEVACCAAYCRQQDGYYTFHSSLFLGRLGEHVSTAESSKLRDESGLMRKVFTSVNIAAKTLCVNH